MALGRSFSQIVVLALLAPFGMSSAYSQGFHPSVLPTQHQFGRSWLSAGQAGAQPEQLGVPPRQEQLDVQPRREGSAESGIAGVDDVGEAGRGGFLAPGQFIATYQWNYAYSDEIFLKSRHLFDADRAVDLVSVQNEHVAAVEVGVLERLSFIYELPFQYNVRSLNVAPLSGGALTGRLVQRSGGLSDSRAYFRYWLSPEQDRNLSVYVGVKVPTGEEDSGDVYQNRFLYNDISIQTGTGSWDPLFGFYAYSRMLDYFTVFGGFNYRLTPANQTNARALDANLANPNSTVLNSIADQMNGELGFTFDAGKWATNDGCCQRKGLESLTLRFALVGAGVPKYDPIGDSDGFRRAFNAIYLQPGFTWSPKEAVTIFANAPITVHRYLVVPGSFPDITLSAGLAYRW